MSGTVPTPSSWLWMAFSALGTDRVLVGEITEGESVSGFSGWGGRRDVKESGRGGR